MIQTTKIDTRKFFKESVDNTHVTEERKELLYSIADAITDEYLDREKININFICTHNSRRSQIAQVWSFFAIEYFDLENIFTYSGGTEVTAFHRNTVKTLQGVGFEFNVVDFSHQNPRYLITFKGTKKTILGFSKTFDDPNNEFPYIAITACDKALENCPYIPDAIECYHLPYLDPKDADKTSLQLEKYFEVNQQIAAEMYIIFKEVSEQIKNN